MGPNQGPDRVRHLSPKRQVIFPNLRPDNYCVTSDEDFDYNCIAYAVGKNHTRWWPPVDGKIEGVDWPDGAPIEETVDAFIAAFATEGFSPCEHGVPEIGFEKLALFVDVDGIPTHAAKQLMPTGEWTSKLGGWEDIKHTTLDALEGADPAFGKAARFLRRPVSTT
jgi:hypothetical protein